jgi:signal transduction histidine kinase
VESTEAVAAALEARPPDIVLCDYNLPGFSAEEALKLLRDSGLDASFILVSGAVGEETAAAIMKAGAHDFILKDRLSRLVPAVQRELRDAQVRRQRRRLDLELRQADRLDSLGRLAGGIAHDFNNLLAVIMAYASDVTGALAADHPCRPDMQKISQAAERAAALTRQLLIFSRLEPSQPETLNLNGIVGDLKQLLERTIGEDVEFVAVAQDDLHPVTIDRGKIEQVIMNLVMNSRAAMPDGGRLCIETANVAQGDGAGDPTWVSLTVTDSGSGMTQEVAQRAFEPFFTTKGPGQGTGLGLSTVYGVVKDAGGKVMLRSEPGAGTSVTVLLPAAEAGITRSDITRPVAEDGAGRAILVVEDDDAVRAVVTRMLTRGGYRVIAAATAKDALEIATNQAVHLDALLTDVVMPDMSGVQLAQRIRDDRPQLPVLLMSGYTAGSVPRGPDAAPDLPLLRKPFDAQTLLQHLQGIVR